MTIPESTQCHWRPWSLHTFPLGSRRGCRSSGSSLGARSRSWAGHRELAAGWGSQDWPYSFGAIKIGKSYQTTKARYYQNQCLMNKNIVVYSHQKLPARWTSKVWSDLWILLWWTCLRFIISAWRSLKFVYYLGKLHKFPFTCLWNIVYSSS